MPATVIDSDGRLGTVIVAYRNTNIPGAVKPAPEYIVAAAGFLDTGYTGCQPSRVVTRLCGIDPESQAGRIVENT